MSKTSWKIGGLSYNSFNYDSEYGTTITEFTISNLVKYCFPGIIIPFN